MTTAVEPQPHVGSGPQAWLKRRRGSILIGAALAFATILAVVSGSGGAYTADLDPRNAAPGGAQAVARVLSAQGITVEIVRDAEGFAAAPVDSATTVLITSTENLGRSTAEQVLSRAGGTEIVLVEPRAGIPELFGTAEGRRYGRTREVDSNCTDPRFAGLRAESRHGSTFPSTPADCFRDGTGALLTRPRTGLTVLGAADLLSNEQITRSDNAAIALRLLGNRDRLLWYIPDPADLTGADGVSFSSLLPDWLGPGLLVGSVTMLAVMLWRGRRLGPLAIEPIPVTITAIETTRSRGRLYRKANDRGYAAEALRRAARSELAEHLKLPRPAAQDVPLLVRMVGPHTSLDHSRLLELLTPTEIGPDSDHHLITLANDLAALTREVRHS